MSKRQHEHYWCLTAWYTTSFDTLFPRRPTHKSQMQTFKTDANLIAQDTIILFGDTYDI